jgi:hypothetical protein
MAARVDDLLPCCLCMGMLHASCLNALYPLIPLSVVDLPPVPPPALGSEHAPRPCGLCVLGGGWGIGSPCSGCVLCQETLSRAPGCRRVPLAGRGPPQGPGCAGEL